MSKKPKKPQTADAADKPACDLCDDKTSIVFLHSRCHFVAPLQAELENGILTLRCYVPECGRVVARFKAEQIK